SAPSGDHWVRRIRVGTAAVDITRVPVRLDPTRNLTFYVDSRSLQPLQIPEVTVELEGVAALVPDPGPGPHTLYGGAPPNTSPTFDVQAALPELWSVVTARAEVGEVGVNPSFVPPEVRT